MIEMLGHQRRRFVAVMGLQRPQKPHMIVVAACRSCASTIERNDEGRSRNQAA
jgi:hypothetical protein